LNRVMSTPSSVFFGQWVRRRFPLLKLTDGFLFSLLKAIFVCLIFLPARVITFLLTFMNFLVSGEKISLLLLFHFISGSLFDPAARPPQFSFFTPHHFSFKGFLLSSLFPPLQGPRSLVRIFSSQSLDLNTTQASMRAPFFWFFPPGRLMFPTFDPFIFT